MKRLNVTTSVCSHITIPDHAQSHLAKLSLGAIARRKSKVRVNLSLLPTTFKWLKKHDANANMSACVDDIVRRVIAGELARVSLLQDEQAIVNPQPVIYSQRINITR
ncbi:MAG: hypothetical protein HWQ38_22335 [Nostoc sp. NMS7]|uniref:hypothetical protein n=1 Tax=Nostoc sp. NMS7 TaxID=2815391 RepID=UPI0025E651BB|nr:hypothetical protein [Nostoc sp. NMS7]MBN3949053.1 hypothetical protein [Nostoc sp. NMS7]